MPTDEDNEIESIESAVQRAVRLVRELQSAICFCGAKKQPMQSFCRSHFFQLTLSQRQSLYLRIGSGYEEAYEEARNTFKELENAKDK